jgi:DNA-directed RNA polymerase II subunit RPB11
MSNQPDRFALFILGDKEKRVEIVEDTHIANAATVTLNKEDHTMGNMLRHSVLAVPGVIFSGYRVPHPLEPRTVLKIQTDGTLTPIQALKQGCEKIIAQIGQVRHDFKVQCSLFEDQSRTALPGSSDPMGMGGRANLGTTSDYGEVYGGSYGDLGQREEEASGYVDI